METENENFSKKIDFLINIAFKDGIERAIKEVQKLNNPYILDEFHDRLIKKIKEK